MNTLSVMKAAVIALAFAPVAASADPITYFQLTEGANLENLGVAVPSNGAYYAQPYTSGVITLPVANTTATEVDLAGAISFLFQPKTTFTFSNLHIGIGGASDGVIFGNVSKNGTSVATNDDLFQLQYGSSDFTQDAEFQFTADGTSLYKTLTGSNPANTKFNPDGSLASGGGAGTLQGFTGPLPAPEPAAFALFGLGAGLIGLARRRGK